MSLLKQLKWNLILLAVIFIALGISLVVNPFTMVKYTVIFAGWIFLCNGIIDLIPHAVELFAEGFDLVGGGVLF